MQHIVKWAFSNNLDNLTGKCPHFLISGDHLGWSRPLTWLVRLPGQGAVHSPWPVLGQGEESFSGCYTDDLFAHTPLVLPSLGIPLHMQLFLG